MAEPVSLDVVKAHLRVDGASEDALLAGMIVAARRACEYQTGRSIVGATEILVLDDFPGGADGSPIVPLEVASPRAAEIVLTGGAVAAISSIGYVGADGVSQQLASSAFVADLLEQPARLAPIGAWPATAGRPGAVTITYLVSSLGADDLAVVVQAMLLTLAHWYRNREAVSADARGTPIELPLAVTWLLQPLRQWATE